MRLSVLRLSPRLGAHARCLMLAADPGLVSGGRLRQLHIRARIDPYMRRVTIVRAFMPPSMVTTERCPQKGSAEREFVTALSHATRHEGGRCDDGGASTASPPGQQHSCRGVDTDERR